MRPKGSFMNPTASKLLKQVSRQDLIGKSTADQQEETGGGVPQKRSGTNIKVYEKGHASRANKD